MRKMVLANFIIFVAILYFMVNPHLYFTSGSFSIYRWVLVHTCMAQVCFDVFLGVLICKSTHSKTQARAMSLRMCGYSLAISSIETDPSGKLEHL